VEVDDTNVNDEAEPNFIRILSAIKVLPIPLLRIWLVSVFWYFSALVINIWWTAWISLEVITHTTFYSFDDIDNQISPRGLQIGSLGLLLMGVSSLCGGFFIPSVLKLFDPLFFYMAAAFFQVCLFLGLYFFRSVGFSLFGALVQGVCNNLMSTTPFILIELHSRDAESNRGIYTALFSLCLTFGQIIASIFGGLSVKYVGISTTFALAGIILFIVLITVYVMPWKLCSNRTKET